MERPMNHWQSAQARIYRSDRDILNPLAVLAGLAVAAAAPLLLLTSLLPSPLVLPALSLLALVCAAAVSLVAWWSRAPRQSDGITLWDVAGAAALIGFAAGMLSGPEHILHFFESSARPA